MGTTFKGGNWHIQTHFIIHVNLTGAGYHDYEKHNNFNSFSLSKFEYLQLTIDFATSILHISTLRYNHAVKGEKRQKNKSDIGT